MTGCQSADFIYLKDQVITVIAKTISMSFGAFIDAFTSLTRVQLLIYEKKSIGR